MLFKNATIYTMEEEPFIGDFRVDKGVFTEIGKDLSPKDEEVQDLNGLYVFPGLIDAHSHLGMVCSSIGFEGEDGNEVTDPVTPNIRGIVAIMLILVGVAFIYIENRNKDMCPSVNSLSALSYKDALIIGLFQVVAAVLPGTSRSGATIVGGLMIGVGRAVAAEFTFFLAIPVMFGASLLKLVKFGFAFSVLEFFILVIGMVVAFFVSIFVIRFLMSYIKKHDFKVFGWYRIILGIAVIGYFLAAR